MGTELTYTCDECGTRALCRQGEPKWWQIFPMNQSGKDGETKFVCSPRCLKIYADRLYFVNQPWHFFVKKEMTMKTTPPVGHMLCQPGRDVLYELVNKSVTDPKMTVNKQDVTCPDCERKLLEGREKA